MVLLCLCGWSGWCSGSGFQGQVFSLDGAWEHRNLTDGNLLLIFEGRGLRWQFLRFPICVNSPEGDIVVFEWLTQKPRCPVSYLQCNNNFTLKWKWVILDCENQPIPVSCRMCSSIQIQTFSSSDNQHPILWCFLSPDTSTIFLPMGERRGIQTKNKQKLEEKKIDNNFFSI